MGPGERRAGRESASGEAASGSDSARWSVSSTVVSSGSSRTKVIDSPGLPTSLEPVATIVNG